MINSRNLIYTNILDLTRKRDITRVFDAETTILGFGSGILGVLIAWLLTFPANIILEKITVLGGHVPARMAAKKDAAIALRSE